MAVDIKALREKLKQESQQNQNTAFQSDGAAYQFWNIDTGAIATARFLPDANPDTSPFFWRERIMINLDFEGIVGQPFGKPVRIQVPCMEMYGETCPILTEARRFYKEGNEKLGQKYWKKKSYLFQGFVRTNPLNEENLPDNPIRRFTLNSTLFKAINSYLLDDDTEYSPTDYENGCDFRIKKTQNGTYADYSTSDFARKSSPLTEEELEAIETHGLFDLADFLPKKPDSDHLNIIQEMFEASLNGEDYDPSRFANYYRPYGLTWDSSQTVSAKETKEEKVEETSSEEEAPFDTDEPKKKLTPQELLQKLKKSNG